VISRKPLLSWNRILCEARVEILRGSINANGGRPRFGACIRLDTEFRQQWRPGQVICQYRLGGLPASATSSLRAWSKKCRMFEMHASVFIKVLVGKRHEATMKNRYSISEPESPIVCDGRVMRGQT